MGDGGCKDCGGPLREREDAGGTYMLCTDCGLRQDGLSSLQKRLGGIFGGR